MGLPCFLSRFDGTGTADRIVGMNRILVLLCAPLLLLLASCANAVAPSASPTQVITLLPSSVKAAAKKTRRAMAASAPKNAATVWAQTTPTPGSASLLRGPVVGAVTPQTAVIWVQTNVASEVAVRYSAQPDWADAKTSASAQTDPAGNLAAKIALDDLKPATDYYFDVLVNGVSQLRAPYARFKTFPPPGVAQDFTFVQLTDFSASPEFKKQTFVNAAQENPAFVILGGDFPHGKRRDLDSARVNYELVYDTRTSPSIADFVTLILRHYAVAHIWDDHDLGMDNGDRTNPLLPLMRRVLEEMFPTYPLPQKGNGDWQKFSYAQADFFLLDARSQRDPNNAPNGPNKSMLDGNHLGADGQLEWLKQGLKESTAQWKFIVSPVVFNPTAKPTDAWGAFRYERKALVQFVRENQITGVIVLSGDMHAGAIDNGAHSDFPEMLNNGPNGDGCVSTNEPGEWSEGFFGQQPGPCNGYGVVHVYADPPRVELQVKDARGNTRIALTVPLEGVKK